jgi:hypothetical protein
VKRNRGTGVEDRWTKTGRDDERNESKVPTIRHGEGLRWLADRGDDGRTRSSPAVAVQQGDRPNVGLAWRGFRAEISDYPLSDCGGIVCSSVRAFHPSSLIAVLHVAELDKYRRVFGQI